MRKVFLGLFVLLVGVLIVTSIATAQYEAPPPPAGARPAQAGAPAAGGRQAPAASTKPFDAKDYSGGPWSITNSGDNLTKDEPPMKPAALAKYRSEKTEYSIPPVGNEENTDPLNRCEPGSVPRFYFNGHPVQFLHTPKEIIMLLETYRNFRIFYTDGRKPADHPEGTWYGDSVARWDGNTLVVDSINFNDRSWLDKPGHPHSDQLKVTERFTRTAYDRMHVDINLHDPVNYTADWGGTKNFLFRPDWQIEDYLCSPHDEGFLFDSVRNKATNATKK